MTGNTGSGLSGRVVRTVLAGAMLMLAGATLTGCLGQARLQEEQQPREEMALVDAAAGVMPEVVVTAEGPRMMMPEVVVTARGPRMVLDEVLVTAERPGGAMSQAGLAGQTGQIQ